MRWTTLFRRTPRPATGSAARPEVYADDLFLVSYPKSGNTWMRFILANLLRLDNEGPAADPIDFISAVRYVPEYELHTDEVDAAPRPRVLKSHATFDACFPRVVYLVRDPRDVYVSYFHYMRKRLPEGMDLSGFIRMDGLHPSHWDEHVAGWIDQPDVLVIRYEDMLADTATKVRRLTDYWGHRGFTDAQIRDAVARSSFNQMKKIEQTKGRPFQSETHRERSTPFMRSGKAGAWTDHFSQADHALLIARMGPLMNRLGYDTDHEAASPENKQQAA